MTAMTHDEAVATIKDYAKRLHRFFDTSGHDDAPHKSVAMVVIVPGATFGDYDQFYEALRTLRREP
jgi:hypothetical protein